MPLFLATAHSYMLLFISFGYRARSIAAPSCANPAGCKAVDPVNGYHNNNNNILILFYPIRVPHAVTTSTTTTTRTEATTTISPRESPERIQYIHTILHGLAANSYNYGSVEHGPILDR